MVRAVVAPESMGGGGGGGGGGPGGGGGGGGGGYSLSSFAVDAVAVVQVVVFAVGVIAVVVVAVGVGIVVFCRIYLKISLNFERIAWTLIDLLRFSLFPNLCERSSDFNGPLLSSSPPPSSSLLILILILSLCPASRSLLSPDCPPRRPR